MKSVTEQLPSRGKFYGGALPDGKIVLRPMTTDEEELLLTDRENRMDVIDDVIRRCIEGDCSVDINNMLNSDRVYLMFAIRNLSYGAEYSVTVICPNCKSDFTIQIDIPKDLKIKCLDDTDDEITEIELPSSTVVGIRRLLVKDEKDIALFVKQRKSLKLNEEQKVSPEYTYRLAKHIATIGGKKATVAQAIKLFPMNGRDSLALRQAIEDTACGLDLTINHKCPTCGRKFPSNLEFTVEFFRPRTATYKRRPRDSAEARPATE